MAAKGVTIREVLDASRSDWKTMMPLVIQETVLIGIAVTLAAVLVIVILRWRK